MNNFLKKNKSVLLNIFYPLLALGVVLAIWSVAAEVTNKPLLLPSVRVVAEKFGKLLAQVSFWGSIGTTLLRTLETFLLALVIAFVFAILGTFWSQLNRVLSPIITILRAAPTMAVILLSTLWLEYDKSPILIGFLISFPLLYASIYSAFSGVDKKLLEMAKVYKISPLDKAVSIYLPSVLPSVLDSVKSIISLTLKVVIAAEVIAQTKNSIGIEMMKSNLVFDIDVLIAWTIIAVVLSFMLEFFVLGLKKIVGVKYGYNTK
ncbi:MAG TPA: ABC transporter permease subunit [Clostridia bacterium]|nr:ABC transporter permease subunit [Clostridia bacterium]